ncbi:protein farnesyltransferase subunit beta-like [Panonychus citri]|uniref:protein farnesyltransferase subunit beta-like n=1 Tax=Panonychus citri TaxID=50023 RepID=UPI00230835B6|nr:protein farnesyltransferase subunit beta-like [Panonychus citri]
MSSVNNCDQWKSNVDSLRFCQADFPLFHNSYGFPTKTSIEEEKVQIKILKSYRLARSKYAAKIDSLELNRSLHLRWLIEGLFNPDVGYQSLDAAQPWMVYWIVHSISLLGDESLLDESRNDIVTFLNRCCRLDGGYGGGPDQIPHLATTYGAISALLTLSHEDALASIDRLALYKYLMKMRQPDGSFVMHEDGESDVRGIYCAAAVAYMTGINTNELFEGSAEWLLKCQTYEGGFGAMPDEEAHGGYSFCALAALTLFGQAHRCDLKSLLRWTVMKQKPIEGGFCGRTNKLVDGCYSFWQAGAIAIIESHLSKQNPHLLNFRKWTFNQQALQEYLLVCCQANRGGLIDKPGRIPDFYHTCYDLSGLSVSQFAFGADMVVGSQSNKLIPVHPVYNLTMKSITFANEYFKDYPFSLPTDVQN